MHVSSATPLDTQHLLAWAPLARNPTQDYKEAVRPSQPSEVVSLPRVLWTKRSRASCSDRPSL